MGDQKLGEKAWVNYTEFRGLRSPIIRVEGFRVLIDTGSNVTLISEGVYKKGKRDGWVKKRVKCDHPIRSVSGESRTLGESRINRSNSRG